MRLTICLLLLVLGGCAGYARLEWKHPQGLDDNQRLTAQRECRELAHREARYQSFFYADPFFPFHRSFYYHGSYHTGSFWYEHQLHLKYQDDINRFYRFCMEAKGWRLEQVVEDETVLP